MAWNKRTFARFLARHRRSISAGCAALAVLSLGLALRPASPETQAIPVATHALGAGHRLKAGDVRVADVPASIAPVGANRTGEGVIGRTLAAPVTAGDPILEPRLLGPRLDAWASPAGTNPLPVRFADAGAVDLVEAGHHLDVLAATQSEPGEVQSQAQVIARDVLVLAVVRPPQSGDTGLPLGRAEPAGDGAGHSDLVILATTPEQTLAITAAQASSRLSFGFVARASPVTGYS